jgi:hypothetical protein
LHSSAKAHRYRAALLLSLPALCALILFHYIPLLYSVYLSFTDYRVFTGERTWVGLKHYQIALTDPLFIDSLGTTVIYFFMRVPVQIALALGLALLIAKPSRMSVLLRTVILLPTVLNGGGVGAVGIHAAPQSRDYQRAAASVRITGAELFDRSGSGSRLACTIEHLERCRAKHDFLFGRPVGNPA